MKTKLFAVLVLAASGVLLTSGRAAETLVEAEARPTAGDMKVLDLPEASGGKAVSMPRDWQPLFKAPVPAEGAAFTVWVRYRDGAVLLKSLREGKQKDLKWSYSKPPALKWVKIGRFTREEIGETLLVIRGGGGGEGPILDAVVFATDEAYQPAEPAGGAATAPSTPGTPSTPAAPATATTQAAPVGVLIEAEAKLPSGDTKVIDEAGASGGQAIFVPRDWQPLLKAAIPAAGDAFTIWVRYRSGSVLVKSSTAGTQKDLKRLSAKPEALTWTNAGRYTRQELGDMVIVIRGGGGGQGAVLDAVVFSPDENAKPGEATKMSTPVSSATASSTPAGGAPANTAGINEAAAIELGMAAVPTGTFIEAEANNPRGDNKIIEAAGASGGKAVTSDKEWQLIFEAPVPAGEAFKVWVRLKNGPISVKAKGEDGKMKDHWSYRRPQNWTWTDMGVYAREALGEKLRLGRGGASDKAAPIVDAVVFAPDKVRPLPADKPDPNAAPQTLAATVDWNKAAGEVSPMIWGINEHEILKPDKAGDKTFQELLGSINAPLIRIHHAGLTDSWTDAKTRRWDVEKIKAGFAASTGYGNAKVMVCLNWAPKWLSETKVIPADKEDEFAALCGQLAKIMRNDVKRKIDYWEFPNELEGSYERAGRLDDLWRLYNKIAVAIRKEDPNAKTGGPALTYAKAEWVQGFLKNCLSNTDFITWHNYGTGDHFESNESLFSKVDSNVGFHARGVLAAIKKHAPNKKLETFLSETNVKYTWDPYERRHQNVVGAIFIASLLRRMALDGVDGVALWQQRGQAYGTLIEADNKTFPALQLYRWGPKYLTGKMAQAISPDEKQLEMLAVTRTDGTKSVLLINKSDHIINTPAAGVLLPGFKRAERLDADGHTSSLTLDGELALPGYSLTLLTTTG